MSSSLQEAVADVSIYLRYWRRRLVLSGIVFLPLLGLVGFYVHQWFTSRQMLQEAFAAADALDPGWRIGELEAKRATIPDAENGALVVLSAGRLPTVMDWSTKIRAALDTYPEPNEQLSLAQIAILDAELKKASRYVDEARRLACLPRGRFPPDPRNRERGLSFFVTGRVSDIVYLLSWDSAWRAQQGDLDGAILSCQAMLNARRACGDEPLFGAQIERSTHGRELAEKVERVLAQGEASDAVLRSLQSLAEKELHHPAMLIGLRGYRAGLESFLNTLDAANQQFPAYRLPRTWLPLESTLEFLFSKNLQSQRAAIITYLNQAVEITKLPVYLQSAEFNKFATTLKQESFLVKQLVGPVGYYVSSYYIDKPQMNCLVIALAVERFRLKNQRWPTSLTQLIPDQLSVIPTDAAMGNAPCLIALPDGVLVFPTAVPPTVRWVGPLRPFNIGARTSGFRLWDVAHRRQPARDNTPNGSKR